MREFKFRAFDTRLKKMIYTGYSVIGEVTAFGGMEAHIGETIHLTPEIKSPMERWNDIVQMQYTGLKDKNGKEIYEGDIVSYENPYNNDIYKHIVRWDDKLACFALFHKNNSEWAKESDWLKITNIEVIGNIYQNPELS